MEISEILKHATAGVLEHWIEALVLLVGAAVMAWLKARREKLAGPLLYALVTAVCLSIFLFPGVFFFRSSSGVREINEEITKLEGSAIVLQHEPIPGEIEINLNGQILPVLEKFGFLVRGRVLLFEGPIGEGNLRSVRDSVKNGLVMVKYKYQE